MPLSPAGSPHIPHNLALRCLPRGKFSRRRLLRSPDASRRRGLHELLSGHPRCCRDVVCSGYALLWCGVNKKAPCLLSNHGGIDGGVAAISTSGLPYRNPRWSCPSTASLTR